MTRVAAGWPTTFCDKTPVKSSTGSVDGFFDRFCEFFGFSTPPSALIIAAADVFTRLRRLSSGRFGSFIKWPLSAVKRCRFKQFISIGGETQKNSRCL